MKEDSEQVANAIETSPELFKDIRKKDSEGRPYTYFRNYIEKGPLLGELIARAAKDE